MKQYRHIIFDLDGTLTDSKPGILNAAVYTYKILGYKKPSLKKLNEFIGIPLQDYFRELSGFNEKEIDKAVSIFREYYGKRGVYENKVYHGVPELLKNLKDGGKKIYISTAKYEKYAWVMIMSLNLDQYIIDMAGADAGGIHATKTELTSKIIKRNRITDLSGSVVIGDKSMDIEAGHQNMIDSIAVTYGFGSVDELRSAEPTHMIDAVTELSDILL